MDEPFDASASPSPDAAPSPRHHASRRSPPSGPAGVRVRPAVARVGRPDRQRALRVRLRLPVLGRRLDVGLLPALRVASGLVNQTRFARLEDSPPALPATIAAERNRRVATGRSNDRAAWQTPTAAAGPR